MDRQEILAKLDEDRSGPAYFATILEARPSVTRARISDNSHHWIAYSSLKAQTADAVIKEEIAHHRALGVGFEWTVYGHDEPRDMIARLKAQGFTEGPCEAVMVYDLTLAAEWVKNAEANAVVRVDQIEQIAIFRRVAEAVFNKEYAFTAGELAEAINAGSSQHRGYIAYDGDVPVGVGRLYTHPQRLFAGFYGGGTLKEYRGRGFYRTVVAARARDALACGARYLRVDTLPTSRPILERMGFVKVTDTWPCEWRP